MVSYSILGIEKESSMEDIEKAYIDKISKIKKEVKNEKNAAAFEAVLTKAYNDILSQKENISEEQELAEEATDCEVDDLEYDEYEEYNDLDYDDFEDGQVVDKDPLMNMMTTMIINLKRERKRRLKEGLILKAKRIKK